MAIKKGNFILIDYVAKVKETSDVFDTTMEEVAKKERLYKEGEIYESKLLVVGEGWMLKALEDDLPNFKLKKTASVEIPPEKAFGPRDPEKVRLVPLRRLTTRGITPQQGKRIELDGKFATVRTIGSGRVQLDFNPPLAGKTLVYDITVQKKLETKVEKITVLIHRRIPAVEVEKFNMKITKKSIVINVPEEAFYLEGLQLAKRGIANDVQKFFPETTTIKFVETFKKQETRKEKPLKGKR
ncbi:MAG: peptidylprolyl isomerase [Candidatus Bathyarchaeota archaeon]|nr:MAG: peptidylprolyl isomerase [Candidatus Bathyarchaeota archaeon]